MPAINDLLNPPATPQRANISLGDLLLNVLKGIGGKAYEAIQQTPMPPAPPPGANKAELEAAFNKPAYQEAMNERLGGYAGMAGTLAMRPSVGRVIPHIEHAPAGAEITPPAATYNEGTGNQGNVWVRPAATKSNADRTLLVQYSTDVINPKGTGPKSRADAYYDKLYASRAGYDRPQDFWEIPQWQANLAHNLPKSDVYVVRNPQEAVQFANAAGYKNVAFSALDVNKSLIRDFAQQYNGKVVVGGYGDLKTAFKDLPNVEVHPTVKSFIEGEGEKYTPGYDYRHYSGTKTVPRLTMSDGCLHQCAFCTVPKKITEKTKAEIMQQADAFAKDLPSSLVYVNDKTFGQAKNHNLLPEVYERIKSQNPDFNGFVIQTTAAQMKKMDPQFLKDSGIKYAELGIESFNDPVLRAAKKPATEAIIDSAANKLRDANVQMIPNIMVGLPGETPATYNRTMSWLNRNADNISHVNAYNLAVYEDAPISKALKTVTEADKNENVIAKSWMDDPAAHTDFNERVMDFGSKQLDKTPMPVKQTFTTIGGQGIAPELKTGPQLEELLNPPPPAPKGAKYQGYQQGTDQIPGFHLFNDEKTGSTFAVKPGEDPVAQMAANRAKFEVKPKSSLDFSKLGTEVTPEDFSSGWITPEGKLIDIGGKEHPKSLFAAGAKLKKSGDWMREAESNGLVRATTNVWGEPKQSAAFAQLFTHPTDAQIEALHSLEKAQTNSLQFELTHPDIGARPLSLQYPGVGVNQIKRAIRDTKFRPELGPISALTEEQPMPNLMDLLNPPQLTGGVYA